MTDKRVAILADNLVEVVLGREKRQFVGLAGEVKLGDPVVLTRMFPWLRLNKGSGTPMPMPQEWALFSLSGESS